MDMRRLKILAVFGFLLFFSPTTGLGQSDIQDDCTRTAQMAIYSDAWVSKETGDLSGFELALDKEAASRRNALLFVYEGGGSEPIPLNAASDGKNLLIEGTWVEHLTEYPSKKKIVDRHRIRILGKLTPKNFRGTIAIEGLDILNAQKLQLRRVKHIWFCKTRRTP